MTSTPHDPETPWYQQIQMPALLRHARTAYRRAIRAALTRDGFEDLPANGPFVLGAIARSGTPLDEITPALGLTRRASNQLVDTLVTRGYLDRFPDPDDPRRLQVRLTARGEAAAATVAGATADVDARWAELVAPAERAVTRQALAALTRIAVGA